MKPLKFISVLFAFVIVYSCGPRVQTVRPTQADLSTYETFAYLPNSTAEAPNKAYNDETVNETVIQTINFNMEQAGYTLDRTNPDLLVLVSTKTDIETATETEPVYATYPYQYNTTQVAVRPYYNDYYYYNYPSYTNIVGYDVDRYAYKEGSVIINLVDRETKKSVWKGISDTGIYNQTDTQVIRNLVNEIFKELPKIK
jgi:hypothetical protein